MEHKTREDIKNISAGYKGDTITSLAVESVQERAIEMGLGFVCTSTISVDAESTAYFTMTTPETRTVTLYNFFATVDTATVSKFEVFEGAIITAETGSQTSTWNININRSSANTAETVYLEEPTITDEGDKIMEIFT
jgi:hypothetical protein